MRQIKMPLKIVRPELAEIKTLREIEQAQIELALERLNGNITEAAEVLGVARATLYRRVIGFGLKNKVIEFRRTNGYSKN